MTKASISCQLAAIMMSGWVGGRALISQRQAIASGLVAEQATPKTVSVGNPITPPAASAATARSTPVASPAQSWPLN